VWTELEHQSLHIPAGTSSPEGALTTVHRRGPRSAKKQKCRGLCANVSEIDE
jgi:hypothetical protein